MRRVRCIQICTMQNAEAVVAVLHAPLDVMYLWEALPLVVQLGRTTGTTSSLAEMLTQSMQSCSAEAWQGQLGLQVAVAGFLVTGWLGLSLSFHR